MRGGSYFVVKQQFNCDHTFPRRAIERIPISTCLFNLLFEDSVLGTNSVQHALDNNKCTHETIQQIICHRSSCLLNKPNLCLKTKSNLLHYCSLYLKVNATDYRYRLLLLICFFCLDLSLCS